MPFTSKRSQKMMGKTNAKKSKHMHGEPSSTSSSEVVDMDVEHGESIPPIPPDPALSHYLLTRCRCLATEPLASTHPMAARDRDEAFANELNGLHVDIPWAGWGNRAAHVLLGKRPLVDRRHVGAPAPALRPAAPIARGTLSLGCSGYVRCSGMHTGNAGMLSCLGCVRCSGMCDFKAKVF